MILNSESDVEITKIQNDIGVGFYNPFACCSTVRRSVEVLDRVGRPFSYCAEGFVLEPPSFPFLDGLSLSTQQ